MCNISNVSNVSKCHGTPYCEGVRSCGANNYVWSPFFASALVGMALDWHLSKKIDELKVKPEEK